MSYTWGFRHLSWSQHFDADILFFHGATEQPVLSRRPSTIKEQMIFRSVRNVPRCAGLQLASLDCCWSSCLTLSQFHLLSMWPFPPISFMGRRLGSRQSPRTVYDSSPFVWFPPYHLRIGEKASHSTLPDDLSEGSILWALLEHSIGHDATNTSNIHCLFDAPYLQSFLWPWPLMGLRDEINGF